MFVQCLACQSCALEDQSTVFIEVDMKVQMGICMCSLLLELAIETAFKITFFV